MEMFLQQFAWSGSFLISLNTDSVRSTSIALAVRCKPMGFFVAGRPAEFWGTSSGDSSDVLSFFAGHMRRSPPSDEISLIPTPSISFLVFSLSSARRLSPCVSRG